MSERTRDIDIDSPEPTREALQLEARNKELSIRESLRKKIEEIGYQPDSDGQPLDPEKYKEELKAHHLERREIESRELERREASRKLPKQS